MTVQLCSVGILPKKAGKWFAKLKIGLAITTTNQDFHIPTELSIFRFIRLPELSLYVNIRTQSTMHRAYSKLCYLLSGFERKCIDQKLKCNKVNLLSYALAFVLCLSFSPLCSRNDVQIKEFNRFNQRFE